MNTMTTGGPVDHDSMTDLVAMLRRRGTDITDVEVKSAGGGLPKSLPETISAFSNDLGGTIILGLAERTGFGLADGFDAAKMRDDLASMCADSMSPPIRASIEIVDFEDGQVVVADVPALNPQLKPCFVKTKGEYAGSYTRGGDGDRRLTDYEIAQLHANRGQPRDDQDLILESTVEDLDASLVAALLRRVKERRPSFVDVSDEQALRRLKVVAVAPDGRLVPTLTGLLAVGTYPQQFFPQLNVTFVVVPATRMDLIPADGPRFLDNRSFEGPIPVIVQDALRAITRNMTVSSHIEGAGREDRYEYPVEAVREAVVNAVMHRDYGSLARGTQVQIEMYQDRLVVRSPGGIFGPITTEDLGDEGATSSRNQYLARLLEDVELPGSQRPVCENRGSGIPSMIQALRRVGMTTPKFDSSLNRFQVAFPKHALLDAATHEWIAGLGQGGLSDAQCMALALMRDDRPVSNQSLRLLGLERHEATAALTDLVARDLVVKQGGRRYAQYVLTDHLPPNSSQPEFSFDEEDAAPESAPELSERAAQIAALFTDGRVLTSEQVARAVGLKKPMATRHLNSLIALGIVEATAPARSKSRAYRRIIKRDRT
jgi:ATP-dependent DNA helicase RecG